MPDKSEALPCPFCDEKATVGNAWVHPNCECLSWDDICIDMDSWNRRSRPAALEQAREAWKIADHLRYCPKRGLGVCQECMDGSKKVDAALRGVGE